LNADKAVENIWLLLVEQLAGREPGSERLIRAGLDAVLAGVNSPSMVLLAGLGRREEPEARELFSRVVEELGLGPGDIPAWPSERRLAVLRWFAQLLIDGRIDFADGCGYLQEFSTGLSPAGTEAVDPLVLSIMVLGEYQQSWGMVGHSAKDIAARTADVVRQAREFLARTEPT
jgi:hypothetical protein